MALTVANVVKDVEVVRAVVGCSSSGLIGKVLQVTGGKAIGVMVTASVPGGVSGAATLNLCVPHTHRAMFRRR